MKWRLFLGLFWVVALEGTAQKFVAEKSVITFFSDALIEDITATNTKTVSLFNKQTGEIAFSVPISQFQFEKKLMQDWEKALPHSPVVMVYVGSLASFVKGQQPEAVAWTIRLFQQLNLPTIETVQQYTQTNSFN